MLIYWCTPPHVYVRALDTVQGFTSRISRHHDTRKQGLCMLCAVWPTSVPVDTTTSDGMSVALKHPEVWRYLVMGRYEGVQLKCRLRRQRPPPSQPSSSPSSTRCGNKIDIVHLFH